VRRKERPPRCWARGGRESGIGAPVEVVTDIPGPQFDDVSVGVVDVRGAARLGRVERHLLDLESVGAEPRYRGVVVGVGKVHCEVHVNPTASTGEPHLRTPEPDARAVAGHYPQGVTVRPPVDDRKSEDARVEVLRRREVDHFEYELTDTGYRDAGRPARFGVHAAKVTGSPRDPTTCPGTTGSAGACRLALSDNRRHRQSEALLDAVGKVFL